MGYFINLRCIRLVWGIPSLNFLASAVINEVLLEATIQNWLDLQFHIRHFIILVRWGFDLLLFGNERVLKLELYFLLRKWFYIIRLAGLWQLLNWVYRDCLGLVEILIIRGGLILYRNWRNYILRDLAQLLQARHCSEYMRIFISFRFSCGIALSWWHRLEDALNLNFLKRVW